MALKNYYAIGTASVTSGSAAVVGVGTLWNSNVRPNDVLWIAGVDCRILSVTDDTHLTLAFNWPGSTASGSVYEIRLPPPSSDLTTAVRTAAESIMNIQQMFDITGTQSAGDSALLISGATFTGGTATTTKPSLLVEPSGVTSTGWSTSGTLIGANAASGFAGRLLDLQLDGVSVFSVNSDGSVSFSGGGVGTGDITVDGSVLFSSRSAIGSPSDGKILFTNEAGTDFNILQLGGTTTSFPGIKRNGTGIDFSLADGSALAPISAGTSSLGRVLVGAPTGGDQGAGTINAQAIFVNGVAVGAAATFIYNRYNDTATQDQTVFTHNYTTGYLDVYQNGAKLSPSQFTATDGTTITLVNPARQDDDLEFIAYSVLSLTTPSYTNPVTFADGGVWNANGLVATNIPGRNLLVNGAFSVDQEAKGSVTFTNIQPYVVDMCKAASSGLTTQTLAANVVTSTLAGFAKSLKITVGGTAAAPATAAYALTWHSIEGYDMANLLWGTAAAKPISISFRAKASVAGTYAFWIHNAALTRSFVTQFILAANTDTLVKIENIPGCTDGVWEKTYNAGLQCGIDLGTGTTLSTSSVASWVTGNYVGLTSSTKLIANTAATFEYTGLQIEQAHVSSPFEFVRYETELHRCMRYWEQTECAVAMGYDSTHAVANVYYKVLKRTNPTAISIVAAGGLWTTGNTDIGGTLTAAVFASKNGPTMTQVMISGISGTTQGALLLPNNGCAVTADARL